MRNIEKKKHWSLREISYEDFLKGLGSAALIVYLSPKIKYINAIKKYKQIPVEQKDVRGY